MRFSHKDHQGSELPVFTTFYNRDALLLSFAKVPELINTRITSGFKIRYLCRGTYTVEFRGRDILWTCGRTKICEDVERQDKKVRGASFLLAVGSLCASIGGAS